MGCQCHAGSPPTAGKMHTRVYCSRMDIIELKPRITRESLLAVTERGWRLGIPAGDNREYRLAQLDDHAGLSRANFIWRAPLTLSLRARVSSPRISGTWGFGLWNDPFGLACGPTSNLVRLPTLPQAVWFFSASSRSYLSLRDDRPANGFLAQVFRSPKGGPWLISALLAFPFAAKSVRHRLSRRIGEDAVGVESNPCTWHRYEIRWQGEATEFLVDKHVLLKSTVSPRAPLGLVIWIDNQYAAFNPRGMLAWGVESYTDEAWLEVEDVRCSPDTTVH